MASESRDTPVLDLLTSMTLDSVRASSLDSRSLMLVRIAALVAVDAPPASYFANLAASADAGIGADDLRGVLTAIAPIVGTPRVVGATGNIVRALGALGDLAELAAELAELDEDAEE